MRFSFLRKPKMGSQNGVGNCSDFTIPVGSVGWVIWYWYLVVAESFLRVGPMQWVVYLGVGDAWYCCPRIPEWLSSSWVHRKPSGWFLLPLPIIIIYQILPVVLSSSLPSSPTQGLQRDLGTWSFCCLIDILDTFTLFKTHFFRL